MKEHILVIDDDEKLCNLLKDYLTRYEYQVVTKTHPNEAFDYLMSNSVELIILDVMLPEMDGFEVLKKLRKDKQIPVIMLTARGDTMDKIVGLELGADDYLGKPFEPRELLARIQSILRRTQQLEKNAASQILSSEDLQVDMYKRIAYLNNADLELTTMEFEVLLLLMRHPSRVISRDDIMEEIRGIDWDAYNRSIDVAMSRLRTKLKDDAKHPKFVKTIWGRGYQFIGLVQNHG